MSALIVNPEVNLQSLALEIHTRIDGLSAGLTLITGEGGESFRCWNDKIQDQYLYSLRESAVLLGRLVEHYSDQIDRAANGTTAHGTGATA